MPQAHRKEDVGDKSRMMAAGKLSESTLRNVNVTNSLEAKMAKVRLNVLERNAIQNMHKIRHYQEKIQDIRRKTLAYQKVVAKHPIHDAPDYLKALDEKYTLHSFRHEIKEMLHKLHPDTIRKKNAQVLIEASREEYQDAIHTSEEYFNSLLPPKPKFIPSLYYDRKPQFRPSWHEEPVFVAKHQKNRVQLPLIIQPGKDITSKNARTTEYVLVSSRSVPPMTMNIDYINKERKHATKDEKVSSRKAEQATRNIDDVAKDYGDINVQATKSIRHMSRNVCHATRKDKRNVLNDRLPSLTSGLKGQTDVNKNDNIKEWVNTIPTREERKKRRNKRDNMVPHETNISTKDKYKQVIPKISIEDQSKPKTRIRKIYTDKPIDDSDVDTPRDDVTRKQYGAHRLKQNQAKEVLAHKSSDHRVHEKRNDSGYGTAESDLEITPRLRDGKEWKSMQQSKENFTQ